MHLDWCKVSYVGKLDDGTVVVEATDQELHVGDNEVVQGLDMALALMNLGEKAEVKVHPRFAYGALGLTNEADNNSTVIVPPDATVCTRIRDWFYLFDWLSVLLHPSGHIPRRVARL